MYRCFAYMHIWVPCVCSSQGGQKRAQSPLEVELLMVVKFCVGAGNEAQVLCRITRCC